MKKKIKKVYPSKGKRIKQPEVDILSTDDSYPLFSLSFMDRNYCITSCSPDEKAAFADQIRLISQLKWINLKLAPRHGAGYEKITRIKCSNTTIY